jgi:hypothetical protein
MTNIENQVVMMIFGALVVGFYLGQQYRFQSPQASPPSSVIATPSPIAAFAAPSCIKHAPTLQVDCQDSKCIIQSAVSNERTEWSEHALFTRPPVVDNKMAFSFKATHSRYGGPVVGWADENTVVTERFPPHFGLYFCQNNDIQFLFASKGTRNPDFSTQFGARGVSPNEVITTVFDIEKKTLSFQRQGSEPVLAISGLPSYESLLPIVMIRDHGDSAAIYTL